MRITDLKIDAMYQYLDGNDEYNLIKYQRRDLNKNRFIFKKTDGSKLSLSPIKLSDVQTIGAFDAWD